jgi:hypothetical protein
MVLSLVAVQAGGVELANAEKLPVLLLSFPAGLTFTQVTPSSSV